MKRLMLATTAVFAMACGAADAADLPAKAPVYKAPPAAAVMNWAGFYAGVHAGWGSSQFTGTYRDVNDFGPMDFSVTGGVLGGQLGYNLQFGRIVHGVELDGSWANLKGDINDNTLQNREFKTNFLGSLRYRGGIALDNMLLYSTIGIGVERSKFTVTGATPNPASVDMNAWGLVSGFGAEWAFAPNWSVRGEYLYFYFNKDVAIPNLTAQSSATDFVHLDGIHVVRLAANYRFGGTGVAPPMPAPSMSWGGFYAGAHGGYGLSRIPGVYDEIGDSGAFAINPRGFVGGGQVGYNWQSGMWVYGIEADATWGGMKRSRVDRDSDEQALKTDVLASARLRVGAAAGDKLLYLTGGLGYAHSKLTVTGSDTPSPAAATLSSFGPVAGAGVDWAFMPNWSLRLETLTYFFNNNKPITTLTDDSDRQDFIRQSMVAVTRLGVNYRFGP